MAWTPRPLAVQPLLAAWSSSSATVCSRRAAGGRPTASCGCPSQQRQVMRADRGPPQHRSSGGRAGQSADPTSRVGIDDEDSAPASWVEPQILPRAEFPDAQDPARPSGTRPNACRCCPARCWHGLVEVAQPTVCRTSARGFPVHGDPVLGGIRSPRYGTGALRAGAFGVHLLRGRQRGPLQRLAQRSSVLEGDLLLANEQNQPRWR